MGNFSRFFIERPIFASVVAILITLAGIIASQSLPVSQYPDISPPTITISTVYPGASADTISQTVAAPIEEQLSGTEGMIYFVSSASQDGSVTITCTFEVGTDVDRAVVQLNNRVQVALPRLPDEVRRNGIIVAKRSPDILLVVALTSPNGSVATTQLGDYAAINIADDLKRVPGTGDLFIFGAGSSMRIWLKPEKMAQLGVTPTDIANVVRGQNTQFAAGKVGAEPAPPGQALTFTVTARGRLARVEEFENLIVRARGPNGVLRIKDVATVELGALNYDTAPTVDGKPAVGMAIFLAPGANALNTAEAIKARLVELKGAFPKDMDYIIPFDTTIVVKASIHEVEITIFEAAILVLAVVFIFLQTWRATLIPMLAVPVSIVGTFAGLYVLGLSINVLTLFAMVLAIGIVVDDAIVVLENVERLMRTEKMGPKQAAIEAMREVSGALIAIILVLCSVFIPVAFLGGIAGQLYKQFAVTVTVAVVISGFTALTLTPALCALMLKAEHHESKLFHPFNVAFDKTTRFFLRGVDLALARRVASLIAFAIVLAWSGVFFWRVPTSFVPSEDQGYLIGSIILPDAASLQRTQKTGAELWDVLSKNENVAHAFVVPGRDFIGGANKTSAGTTFVLLKHWDERKQTAQQVAADLTKRGMGFADGMAIMFNPPAIRGLGSAGGFEFYIQSRGKADTAALGQVITALNGELAKDPELTGITTFYRPTGAADARRGEPRAGDLAGRSRDRRLRRAAEHVRRAVRERLQHGRPRLPRPGAVRGPVPRQPGPDRQHVRAFADHGRDGPDPGAHHHEHVGGPRAGGPLQRLPRGEGARIRQARRVLGTGDRCGGAGRGEGAARGLHALMERPGVPGKAHRQAVGPRLRPGDPHGVPHPLRALRALAPALGRGARRAVRRARSAGPRVAARHGERHLLPDRPHRADRPRGEERDPDRGIRAAGTALGHECQGSGGAGRAPSLPPDRDDLARLRVRRAAACRCQRRGRRLAALDGHGRGGRHDARHLRRDHLRAALLHGVRAAAEDGRAARQAFRRARRRAGGGG
jgi:multidrug efflux pump subunit AcrB